MIKKTVEECYREWNVSSNVNSKEEAKSYSLEWFTKYFKHHTDYSLYIKEYIAIQKIIMNYD